MDDSEQTLSKRVRKAELLHFNYILTIGMKEVESNTLDVREHGKCSKMSLNEFI